MRDFVPWILHDGMEFVHELVELEFMKEFIGLQSISIED